MILRPRPTPHAQGPGNLMGFIMEGLDAEAYDRTYTDRQLVARIRDYFRPAAASIGLVTGMVVLASLLDAALPILISEGLDRVVGETGAISREVWLVVAGLALFGALSWGANYVRQRVSTRIVGDIVLDLRTDAIDAVLKRDMSFYDQYASGKIVSRVTSDTNDFSTTVTLVLSVVSQLLMVVVVMGVLFMRSTVLALMVLALVPVIVAVALGFRKIAREVTIQSQRAQGEVNGMIAETMRGISVAKSYRQEATIYREFEDVSERMYRVRLKQGFIFSGIFPLLFAIAGLGTTLLVWFG